MCQSQTPSIRIIQQFSHWNKVLKKKKPALVLKKKKKKTCNRLFFFGGGGGECNSIEKKKSHDIEIVKNNLL